MLRIPIIITLTFFSFSFFQFFSSEQPEDRSYMSFSYYFNSEAPVEMPIGIDCIDDIRVNKVRKELSSMIRWRTRSTSIIDDIIDDMESCDSIYFENDPIYHLLISINNRDRNRYFAYIEGLKAYELFESQNDTSGMVNSLYFFAYMTWEDERQNSDFYTDKLLSLSKASSNKRDNLLYYNILLRNLCHNPNIGGVNYDKYVDSVRQIVKQDSSLILDYSTILGIVNSVAYYDGMIEKAHNYCRENYALPIADQDYHSVMNYAETFTEDHQKDSMLHYYNITFDKYSQAAYKPLEFSAFFYGRKSDYYKKYNDVEKAWLYRNLKDSIDSIVEKLEEKSKIQEYKSKLIYNTQELSNKQLETEKSFLVKTNIFLLLLLLTFVLLSLNYYKRKEEAQRNLKFKEKAFRLISHDMLSPLQVLTGYIDMVKRKANTDNSLSMNKPLNVISNHVNRLSDLAHNTIDYIWQSNKVEKPQILEYVFVNSVEFFSLFSLTRNVTITAEENENCLKAQVTFPDAAAAIIRNILSNIVKHSDATAISIKSRTDNKILQIEIYDNATPLDHATLNQIRESISQSAMNEISSSIGLSIIREKLYKSKSKLVIKHNNDGNKYILTVQC